LLIALCLTEAENELGTRINYNDDTWGEKKVRKQK